MSVSCRNAAASAVVLLGVLVGNGGCASLGLSGSNDGPKLVRPKVESLPDNIPTAKTPAILPDTHFAAARLFEARGMTYRAIEQYRRVIAVSHKHTEAHHRLGLLLSLVGQRDEAVKMLRRAVLLRPGDAVFHNNLGFELVLAKKFVEGESQLRRAIALKGDFARAHVNLGIALSKRGRFAEALASFRQVLPEPDAYYNLGLLYEGEGRFADATEAFNRALALDSEFTAAGERIERLAARISNEPPDESNPLAPMMPPSGERTALRDAPMDIPKDVNVPATATRSAHAAVRQGSIPREDDEDSPDESRRFVTAATKLASSQEGDSVRSAERREGSRLVASTATSSLPKKYMSERIPETSRSPHQSGSAVTIATPAPKRRGQALWATDVDELLELIEREITPWQHAAKALRRAKITGPVGRARASSLQAPDVWPAFDVERDAADAGEIDWFGKTTDRSFAHHQPQPD